MGGVRSTRETRNSIRFSLLSSSFYYIPIELFPFPFTKVVYHHERRSVQGGILQKAPILMRKKEGIIMHADVDDMATTVEYFYVFYSFMLRIIISVGQITAHNNQE